MKKKLLGLRKGALDYIKYATKDKVVVLSRCTLDFKGNELLHINNKTSWISKPLDNKCYSTDYLCDLVDELVNSEIIVL